jgi:hypothetical protein
VSALPPGGTHTVQLSHHDGQVVLHFERPVPWVALDPETAGRVAEALAHAAYAVRAGDTPTPEKSQLLDRIRARLVTQVGLMLASFEREAPRPDVKIQATRIVDAVLQEVA